MLGDALCAALAQDGWQATQCTCVAAAKAALVGHRYVAVLLDLGLPGGSGLDVLAAMREQYDATPVLILTARDQLSERIRGLDRGADDYIVKPFQRDELLARLRAVVRRSRGHVTALLRWRDVELDPAQQRVSRDGERIALGVFEYRTLLALMEAKGRTLTRDFLQGRLYGDDEAVGSNTVAVYIHQLRRKLGPEVILTVHGFGYRLGDEP